VQGVLLKRAPEKSLGLTTSTLTIRDLNDLSGVHDNDLIGDLASWSEGLDAMNGDENPPRRTVDRLRPHLRGRSLILRASFSIRTMAIIR
jgi:hypothetical protein